MSEHTEIAAPTQPRTMGERLIHALAGGDMEAASVLLSPAIHFRGLTPKALRDAAGRDDTMAILTEWFPPGDVEALTAIETGIIGKRRRVGYRVRWSTPQRELLEFEQHAYYDTAPDGITWISLVCSGDHPVQTSST